MRPRVSVPFFTEWFRRALTIRNSPSSGDREDRQPPKGPPEINNVSDPITNLSSWSYTNGHGTFRRILLLDNAFATV